MGQCANRLAFDKQAGFEVNAITYDNTSSTCTVQTAWQGLPQGRRLESSELTLKVMKPQGGGHNIDFFSCSCQLQLIYQSRTCSWSLACKPLTSPWMKQSPRAYSISSSQMWALVPLMWKVLSLTWVVKSWGLVAMFILASGYLLLEKFGLWTSVLEKPDMWQLFPNQLQDPLPPNWSLETSGSLVARTLLTVNPTKAKSFKNCL